MPLASILNQLDIVNRELALANIVGNVLLFTPVGLLLPIALGWRWRRSAVAVVACVVGVELLQLVTGRSADIDDVILNSLGGVLAAVPGAGLARRARASDRAGGEEGQERVVPDPLLRRGARSSPGE
ncbi:MAG: VanZ family protein [Quadrisphaera sp.]